MFRKSFCFVALLLPQIIFGAYGYIGQEDNVRTGVLLGARPTLSIPLSDDIEGLSNGMGSDINLGWRMSQNISASVSYFFSTHGIEGFPDEQLNWTGLLFDVKYYIPIVDAYEAYAVGLFGNYTLGDNSLSFTGLGIGFGAGFNWWINQNFSFGPEILFHMVSYSKLKFTGGDFDLDPKLGGNTMGIGISANYKL